MTAKEKTLVQRIIEESGRVRLDADELAEAVHAAGVKKKKPATMKDLERIMGCRKE